MKMLYRLLRGSSKMAYQRHSCFRIILHLFISQPYEKDYGAPHQIKNFLQTRIMKYTFRYSVAYGIQFYKMYLKNIKILFIYKSVGTLKNKSPPFLIDWPAVLHMLVKLDWVDFGGERHPFNTWRDICCHSLWVHFKIVPLFSPYWRFMCSPLWSRLTWRNSSCSLPAHFQSITMIQ